MCLENVFTLMTLMLWLTLFTSKDKTRMLEKHLIIVDFQEQGFSETTVVYSDILKKELIQK